MFSLQHTLFAKDSVAKIVNACLLFSDLFPEVQRTFGLFEILLILFGLFIFTIELFKLLHVLTFHA